MIKTGDSPKPDGKDTVVLSAQHLESEDRSEEMNDGIGEETERELSMSREDDSDLSVILDNSERDL